MRLSALLLSLVTLCGVGCGPHIATSVRFDEAIPRGAKIAVLPFENLSGREAASEKMTDYLVLSLQSLKGVTVAEFGQTYEQMRKYRIRSSFLTDGQIDSLGAGLGAEYLVAGSVLEFTETDNQYLGKIPEISINIRVIKCATKQTIWSGAVNARGDQSEFLFGIGAVRSKDELAHQVAASVVGRIGNLIRK